MKYINYKYNQAEFSDYESKIKSDIISDFIIMNEAIVNHKKQLHHDKNKHE
jgi:hypothetical protein|tara:strand:+ start:725 stop:877 length:153 start_codon:yes stop_codon:yes gene_type:complete